MRTTLTIDDEHARERRDADIDVVVDPGLMFAGMGAAQPAGTNGSELGALCLESGDAIVVGHLWTHAHRHADTTSGVIPQFDR